MTVNDAIRRLSELRDEGHGETPLLIEWHRRAAPLPVKTIEAGETVTGEDGPTTRVYVGGPEADCATVLVPRFCC